MRARSPLLLAATALAALSLFALVFTLLAERGLWPALPVGAFRDTDLWAGLLVGAALLLMLLRSLKTPDGEGR